MALNQRQAGNDSCILSSSTFTGVLITTFIVSMIGGSYRMWLKAETAAYTWRIEGTHENHHQRSRSQKLNLRPTK